VTSSPLRHKNLPIWAPPNQNFWLHQCFVKGLPRPRFQSIPLVSAGMGSNFIRSHFADVAYVNPALV